MFGYVFIDSNSLIHSFHQQLADYDAGSVLVEDAARVALHSQLNNRARMAKLLPLEMEFTMLDEDIDRMIDVGGGAVPVLEKVLKLEQRKIAFDEPKQLEMAIEVLILLSLRHSCL